MRRPLAEMSRLVESRQACPRGNDGGRVSGSSARSDPLPRLDSGEIRPAYSVQVQKPRQDENQAESGSKTEDRTNASWGTLKERPRTKRNPACVHEVEGDQETQVGHVRKTRRRRICWQLRGETTVTQVLRSAERTQVIGIS